MFRHTVYWAGLFPALLAVAAVEAPAGPGGVSVAMYSGWENALVLRGGDCRAVVVPAIGGRLMHFSLNGHNVLYEEPGSGGKTLGRVPEGFAVGGYQCDLGPETRGLPDHRLLWLGAWEWTPAGDHALTLRSAPDPAVGVQLEKEIVMAPDSGELGLVQRMKNVSSTEVSFCLWDRTQCRSGGFAFFPLNKKSRFKSGWAILRPSGDAPAYDGTDPTDPRVTVKGGLLVVEARGPWLKVGADSDAGWIGYVLGGVLFVKYFPVVPGGNYTDGGNTVEFQCDDKVAGLEPLSPEVKLKPGQSYVFPEKWVLLDLERPVQTAADVFRLSRRVPPSPFRR